MRFAETHAKGSCRGGSMSLQADMKDTAELVQEWMASFCLEAETDGFREFTELLEHLDLSGAPESMLEGTVQLVVAAGAYRSMDGQAVGPFLQLQQYRLAVKDKQYYSLVFDFCGKALGRLVADRNLAEIDFADLFNHPWEPYRVAGYHNVWISRVDGEPIDDDEAENLGQLVREDLYYDFDEEDIQLTVSLSDSGNAVIIEVFDV